MHNRSGWLYKRSSLLVATVVFFFVLLGVFSISRGNEEGAECEKERYSWLQREQQLLKEIAYLKAIVSSSSSASTGDSNDQPFPLSLPTPHDKGKNNPAELAANDKIVVLVITYERAHHLQRSIDTILKYLPHSPQISIVISQDGSHEGVASTAHSYQKAHHNIHFLQNADRGPKPMLMYRGEREGYYYIARHYGLALTYAFDSANADYVIIIEDPTLFCISAWNDNGRPGLVKSSTQAYRSDFFPGLGWMMSSDLWKEVGPKWTDRYWDDWLREPPQRKERACIFPEISRTYTFGLKDGTSTGQWADKYLKPTILNDKAISWEFMDLTYLTKENYDKEFIKAINQSTLVSMSDVDKYIDKHLFVEYTNRESAANFFGLMPDEKAGIARTSYRDVIMFWRGSNRIYLAPEGTRHRLSG